MGNWTSKMNEVNKSIFVLDGHDGTGKTTLASLLAQKLNAIYVRPFSGDTGEKLIRLAKEEKYSETSTWGLQAIKTMHNTYPNRKLIFDRHWMTVFTLIPQDYWGQWMPLPPTLLCWADISSTLSRIASRSEKQYPQDYHQYYLNAYKELANQFNCYLLDTSHKMIEESLNEVLAWAQTVNSHK